MNELAEGSKHYGLRWSEGGSPEKAGSEVGVTDAQETGHLEDLSNKAVSRDRKAKPLFIIYYTRDPRQFRQENRNLSGYFKQKRQGIDCLQSRRSECPALLQTHLESFFSFPP